MPLDAQAAWMLDTIRAASHPALESLGPEAARAQYAKLMRLIDAKPTAVARIEDGVLPGPGGDLGFRLYRPNGPERAPAPALLFLHGGGGVFGSIETHDSLCRLLAAKARAVVISLDYRRAPEHKFPAAVDDAFAAFHWLAASAETLGIDAARIAVGGDGSGGGLAASLCHMARDAGGAAPTLQFLFYPFVDRLRKSESRRAFATGYLVTDALIDWLTDHYVEPALRDDPRASPLLAADVAGLPPALVITAGFDPLRDEGHAYADRLRQSGVAVVDRHYPGMVHGFFNMSAVLDEAKWAIDEAATFLFGALLADEGR